jgi:hypothetical protein
MVTQDACPSCEKAEADLDRRIAGLQPGMTQEQPTLAFGHASKALALEKSLRHMPERHPSDGVGGCKCSGISYAEQFMSASPSGVRALAWNAAPRCGSEREPCARASEWRRLTSLVSPRPS